MFLRIESFFKNRTTNFPSQSTAHEDRQMEDFRSKTYPSHWIKQHDILAADSDESLATSVHSVGRSGSLLHLKPGQTKEQLMTLSANCQQERI